MVHGKRKNVRLVLQVKQQWQLSIFHRLQGIVLRKSLTVLLRRGKRSLSGVSKFKEVWQEVLRGKSQSFSELWSSFFSIAMRGNIQQVTTSVVLHVALIRRQHSKSIFRCETGI
jgi:hypothetical protein